MGKNQTERIQELENKIQQLQYTVDKQIEAQNSLATELREANDIIKQLINDTVTKITVETARREREIQTLKSTKQDDTNVKVSNVELIAPTFNGEADEHPKQYLKDLNAYFLHKNTSQTDRMIIIENGMKGKAAKWFGMVKDATPNVDTFRSLFLKHLFSEDRQWDIFIRCTETGKKPINENFQEHFHFWMAELKYLESPKIDETQAINLTTKHFPIAIQAYIRTAQEKKFLTIWEKLGELENNYKQNNTIQQNTTNKHSNNNPTQAVNNRYSRNTNQANGNRYNYNQAQSPANHYTQVNSTQQPNTRQSTQHNTPGTNAQKQYSATQVSKSIKICMSALIDDNHEPIDDKDEVEYNEINSKNVYGETMDPEDQ